MAGDHTKFLERVELAAGVPRDVLQYEHHARYAFACSRVGGDILDIACGTGYGSRMLAQVGDVTGVDVDADAVRTASATAAGRFLQAGVPPIPLSDDSFDAVVCFETLEHIGEDVAFLRELRRVLRPEGALFVSTPNAALTSPFGPPANPWHKREYRYTALMGAMHDGGFGDIRVYAQVLPVRSQVDRVRRVTAWRISNNLVPTSGRAYAMLSRALFGWLEVVDWDGVAEPVYWVLECR